MQAVTPADVPRLLPDAPEPEQAHVNLAMLWLSRELTRRRLTSDTLTAEQELAARTAVAAKALAFMAGVNGVVTLESVASSGAARVIESVKIPDEIEVKFRAAQSADQALVLASSGWDALAVAFLGLLAGGSGLRRVVGVSR